MRWSNHRSDLLDQAVSDNDCGYLRNAVPHQTVARDGGFRSSTSRRAGALVSLVACAVLASSGCYRPYYYAPPMQTYQGPVAPIQTLTPGPAYVPGQGAPGGLQPIPAPSNSSLGTGSSEPFYGGSESTSNPQPTFDNGTTDTQIYNPPAGNTPVPNYNDPVNDFLTPEIGPSDPLDGPVDSFKLPSNDPQAMLESPTEPPATLEPISSAAPVVNQPVDPLDLSIENEVATIEPMALESTPIETTSDGASSISQTAFIPETVGETTLAPYAYEESTYGWLRGVVNRDPEDGQWTITYDVTPDEFDDFAGHFTLANHAKLSNLNDNDVVLIEGRISASQQDRFGKPLYEIGQLVPLNVAVK